MTTFLPLLAGQWFIVGTNFPMWLSGERTGPSFHYTVSECDGEPVLLDEVSYLQKDQKRTISGVDFPDPKAPGRFTWRGKGWLFFLKSRWEVRLMDEYNQWAVIHFSKTLFTPEGVDIIFRECDPEESLLEEIKGKMAQDELLKPHLETMKRI